MKDTAPPLESPATGDEKVANEAIQPSSTSSDESLQTAITDSAEARIPDRVLASLRRRALDTYHHRPGRVGSS